MSAHLEEACPCCGEESLELVLSYDDKTRYMIECGFCGMRYDHDDFDSYNGTKDVIERYIAKPIATNKLKGVGHQFWCSCCNTTRQLDEGEEMFKFCPDCGAEVAE